MDLITHGQAVGNVSPNVNSKNYTTRAKLLGAELVANGSFLLPATEWLFSAGWSAVGTTGASCDGTQVGASSLVNSGGDQPVVGRSYLFKFTLTEISAGSVTVAIGSDLSGLVNEVGHYSYILTAADDLRARVVAGATFVGNVTDVSCRLMP